MSLNKENDTSLATHECRPCQKGAEPLSIHHAQKLLKQLDPDWRLIDDRHIERDFKFEDFKQGLDFTINVGQLAEEQQHHPEIFLKWGKVTLILWTHKIAGLHENDFIFAAKIDQMLK
ncbi:MAG: 4a-hydroxytetrahydrobiopterin dehydratase [Planctomycetes bacterium]|nr:4a-hydroxytetrahydrobiopterin dehydratase [Planctomycetota bacterium]MBL7106636.1 4a-hydroxytetrahydrobiopterin dehydratase [Phycisphaerae bacterium]